MNSAQLLTDLRYLSQKLTALKLKKICGLLSTAADRSKNVFFYFTHHTKNSQSMLSHLIELDKDGGKTWFYLISSRVAF